MRTKNRCLVCNMPPRVIYPSELKKPFYCVQCPRCCRTAVPDSYEGHAIDNWNDQVLTSPDLLPPLGTLGANWPSA